MKQLQAQISIADLSTGYRWALPYVAGPNLATFGWTPSMPPKTPTGLETRGGIDMVDVNETSPRKIRVASTLSC